VLLLTWVLALGVQKNETKRSKVRKRFHGLFVGLIFPRKQHKGTAVFFDALKSSLFGIFAYSGRAERLEQWVLAFITALFVVGILVALESGVAITGYVFGGVAFGSLWLALAHISCSVRRLHDHDRSGLWMLLPLSGLNITLFGWLLGAGYLPAWESMLEDYARWITLAGRAVTGVGVTMLLPIFLVEGDEAPNNYGERA